MAVLRSHGDWTLEHICSLLEGPGPRAALLRSLTLAELLSEPLELPELPPDGGPPIDPDLLAASKQARGAAFDRHVVTILSQAEGPVAACYLRARLGGPPWKLQTSLRRLIEAGLAERSGTTSATRYRFIAPAPQTEERRS